MDHYKALGVHRNASKEEIKQAFRKLAMQFHPDKHAHSPKQVKDTATLKFKQLSEAYETLTDDRKRADYNIGRREAGNSSSSANYRSGAYAGSRYGYEYNNFGYGYSGYAASGRGKNSGATLHFEGLLRLFTMGTFLRNVAFAGVLIGGMYWIDAGRDALWNMKNSGKSFEEALESIKQAKGVKDKT